MMEKNLIMD